MEKKVIKQSLDRLYENNEAPWGAVADPIVLKAITHLTGNSVLDLGAGDGRNSLFLAQNGFRVTAIDLSTAAINQLKQRFMAVEADCTAITDDIVDFDFPKKINNIVCTLVLHYFEQNEAETVLDKILKATSTGGAVVLSAFTNQGGLLSGDSSRFWPKQEELVQLFESKGYENIEYTSSYRKTLQQDDPTKNTVHQVEEMIFKSS